MSESDLHSAWARLFVSALASAGVEEFVISPGSRSTPLVLAAQADSRVRIHVILDERVAAFFALGQARVTGVASALLCTSGTACAHYLPAVIEAAQSRIPMILLTADRPWEDYDAAAPQTIDQVKLFGGFVRHYAELGLPDANPSALRAVVRIAAQATHLSQAPLPGPVHINARFRKPLQPISLPKEEPFTPLILKLANRGAPRIFSAAAAPDPCAIAELGRACAMHERGIIVCGPAWPGISSERLRAAVLALSQRTGFPVWAEATSGVRLGGGAGVHGGFDALLRSATFRQRHPPALLIEIGSPVLSASYASYLAEYPDCPRIVMAPFGWNDPHGSASHFLFGDPAEIISQVLPTLPEKTLPSAWQERLSAAEQCVFDVVFSELADDVLSEGQVACAVVDALPKEATLMLGNSLPVRDIDLFCPPNDRSLRVLHQRGTSGIDGLIAGAAGARSKQQGALALVLGDLSAQHDLGGLCMLRSVPGPLAVVIVQNGGGRIFEQLPISRSPVELPAFTQLFLTPQDLDFSHAAQAFGLPFTRVDTPRALRQALAQAMASQRPLIIEAVVPKDDGAARRQRIWTQVKDKLDPETQEAACKSETDMRLPRVYLHGFLGAPAQWKALADRLPGPHTLDYLPGHGPRPWSLPDADFFAVVDTLAQRLPGPRCALYGYSLGARLALAIALRHPQRIASLFLIGVDPGIESDALRTSRLAWEDELIRQLESTGLPAFIEYWESLPLFATQRRLPAERLAAQRATRAEHDPRMLTWALRTLGTGRMPNLWPLLPHLRIPTQVFTGSLDAKFQKRAEAMASASALVEHHVIADAGHNLLLEAEAQLLSFLVAPPSPITERISHE